VKKGGYAAAVAGSFSKGGSQRKMKNGEAKNGNLKISIDIYKYFIISYVRSIIQLF